MTDATPDRPSSPFESADWLDPLEEQVRQGIRSLIERLVETELDAVLGRQRYGRDGQVAGYRNGRRDRQAGATGSCSAPSAPPRCRCHGRG